jgi:hypothetical protein
VAGKKRAKKRSGKAPAKAVAYDTTPRWKAAKAAIVRNPQGEDVLFGVRDGDEDWRETVLCTQPSRFEEVKVQAARDGWGRFRVARIDLSAPPDFGGTVTGMPGTKKQRGRARRNPDPHASALIRSIEDQGEAVRLMAAGREYLAKKRAEAKKEKGYEGAYYPTQRTYKVPYDAMPMLAALRQLDAETGQGFEMKPARDLGHTLVRTSLFVPGLKQYAYEEGWESFGPGAMELIEYRWTHRGERESRRGRGHAQLSYRGHFVVYGESGQDTVEVKGDLSFDRPAGQVDEAEIADAIMEDIGWFLDENQELWGDQGGDDGEELENPHGKTPAQQVNAELTRQRAVIGRLKGQLKRADRATLTLDALIAAKAQIKAEEERLRQMTARVFEREDEIARERGLMNPLSGDPDAHPRGPYCRMCWEHEAAPGDSLCHLCRGRLDAEEAEADHEAWLDQQAVIRREYMPNPPRRLKGKALLSFMHPGWEIVSDDHVSTVYMNVDARCAITVRHGLAYGHGPARLDCMDGRTSYFSSMASAAAFVRGDGTQPLPNPFFSPPAIQYSTIGALANPGPLATFTNDADQMQANVYAVRGGFSVAVLDLDSGETDPHIRIYPTLQQATAAARTVLGRS